MISHMRTCWPWVLLLCLCLITRPAKADTPPSAPPAGMTQQQYDALVKAVGESVVHTLEKKGLVAKAPPAAATASSSPDVEEVLANKVVAAIPEIPSVLAGYRDIAMDLVRLSDRLDLSSGDGHSRPISASSSSWWPPVWSPTRRSAA